jgi:hypothetical protein
MRFAGVEAGGTGVKVSVADGSPDNIIETHKIETTTPDETLTKVCCLASLLLVVCACAYVRVRHVSSLVSCCGHLCSLPPCPHDNNRSTWC